MKKKIATAAAALVLAATLAAGPASAAIKVGTDGAEALVGTQYADHITGKGGADLLDGRAGNDVYHFAGGFGNDTLLEPKKVGTLPGGVDTVSFSGVRTNSSIFLIPQWRALGYNAVVTADSGGVAHRVDLGSSVVERGVGGSGKDYLFTGAGPNTLKGGAGGDDYLWDGGGYPGNGGDQVGLPASDDVYRGFAAGPGTDIVVDWGGGADVLDLRPWESSDVHVDTYSYGGSGPNSLIVSNGDRGVIVFGHFAPVGGQENGTMEKIVFADETITSASAVRALVEDSAGEAGPRAAAGGEPTPGLLPGPPPRQR